MDDTVIFTTFFHINDYDEAGYAALPRLIATSYPLVLWAPSGGLLQKCYEDKRNFCSISPKQFITLVEDCHIHIIGRREWLTNKNVRNKQQWPYASWLNDFDDRLLAILHERANAPINQRSVRIVEEEDGWMWAEDYLNRKSEKIVKTVAQLIRGKKVPRGVIDKSFQSLERGNEREAVKNVIRDLRNHVRAIELADAKVPFVSHNDAEFFRLMEAEGTLPEIVRKELVVSSDMGQAIMDLVEQLTSPEHIGSLTGFVGTSLHRELAFWFNRATDVAHNLLSQDFKQSLEKRLLEHAAKGRLSERLTRRLRQGVPLFAPEAAIEADEVITWLAREAIDPDDTLGSSGIIVTDVPAGNRILSDAGMRSSGDQQLFYPHLSNSSSFPFAT